MCEELDKLQVLIIDLIQSSQTRLNLSREVIEVHLIKIFLNEMTAVTGNRSNSNLSKNEFTQAQINRDQP